MAPQKPRTALDDSRSETSSTKERQNLATTSRVAKNQRVANSNASNNPGTSTKGGGSSSKTTNNANPNTNGAGTATSNPTALETIATSPLNWTNQPLSLLHAYRHSYNLPIPSAFTSSAPPAVLSHGIGRHSPTGVASRRAKQALRSIQNPHHLSSSAAAASSSSHNTHQNPSEDAASATRAANSLRAGGAKSSGNGNGSNTNSGSNRNRNSGRGRPVFGGGKVPKEQLTMAVRKHFNAMGVNESETMVRFCYVGAHRNRDFRQRFRP